MIKLYAPGILVVVLCVAGASARDLHRDDVMRNISIEFGDSQLSDDSHTKQRTILPPNQGKPFSHPNNPDNKTFILDPKTGQWNLIKSKNPESVEDTLSWNQNNDIFLT